MEFSNFFSEKCFRLIQHFSMSKMLIHLMNVILYAYRRGSISIDRLVFDLRTEYFSKKMQKLMDPNFLQKLMERDTPLDEKSVSNHLLGTEDSPFDIEFLRELDQMEDLLIDFRKSMDDFDNGFIKKEMLVSKLEENLRAYLVAKLNEMADITDLELSNQNVFQSYPLYTPEFPVYLYVWEDIDKKKISESTSPFHKKERNELDSHKKDINNINNFEFGSESDLDGWSS